MIGTVSYLVVFRLRLFEVLLKEPLAPPIMGLPAVMFGFLMIFMASEAWQKNALARADLVNEYSVVVRVIAVPIEPAAAKQQLRADVRRYLTAVIDEEWTRHNEVRTASAEAALGELETGIMALDVQC